MERGRKSDNGFDVEHEHLLVSGLAWRLQEFVHVYYTWPGCTESAKTIYHCIPIQVTDHFVFYHHEVVTLAQTDPGQLHEARWKVPGSLQPRESDVVHSHAHTQF